MKYLTHQLSQCKIYGFNKNYDFKCDICDIMLYQDMNGNYYLITKNGTKVENTISFVTCDEWIIRKIID